jgi:hypothetical protein
MFSNATPARAFRALLACLLAVLIATGALGCGGSSTSNPAPAGEESRETASEEVKQLFGESEGGEESHESTGEEGSEEAEVTPREAPGGGEEAKEV